MTVQVDIWALLGGIAVMATGIAWLVRLQGRQEGHEDICAERYKQIEESNRQLVKVSDERHTENRERLDGIDNRIGGLEEKIDLALARLR
jgi:hypothetical protein